MKKEKKHKAGDKFILNKPFFCHLVPYAFKGEIMILNTTGESFFNWHKDGENSNITVYCSIEETITEGYITKVD